MNTKPFCEAPSAYENSIGDINSVADRARLALRLHIEDNAQYRSAVIAMMNGIMDANSYEKQIAVLSEYVEFVEHVPS